MKVSWARMGMCVLIVASSIGLASCSNHESVANPVQSSASPTQSADPLGILTRLNSVQTAWAVDENNNLTNHSIAVYASPANEGCYVWVFKSKSQSEDFGSNAVQNAQQPPMYWYGVDKKSKKRVVLLSMGSIGFDPNAGAPKCESAMETVFGVQMLSSL
jgi:hypothetical protein